MIANQWRIQTFMEEQSQPECPISKVNLETTGTYLNFLANKTSKGQSGRAPSRGPRILPLPLPLPPPTPCKAYCAQNILKEETNLTHFLDDTKALTLFQTMIKFLHYFG